MLFTTTARASPSEMTLGEAVKFRPFPGQIFFSPLRINCDSVVVSLLAYKDIYILQVSAICKPFPAEKSTVFLK